MASKEPVAMQAPFADAMEEFPSGRHLGPRDVATKPAKPKPDLPFFRRVAFGTGHVLHVLAIALWYPYDVTFFTLVLELPASSAGTIILIGQVVGAISTPFLGIWSDHTHIKFYRRKIFHLLSLVVGAASFFFIWHSCINCANAPVGFQVLYFALFASLFQFSWACVQISQLSLIPEITQDRNIKVELNSIRYCFTMVAFLVVIVLMWILLEKLGGGAVDIYPGDKKIFWIAALFVIIVGLLVASCFQLFIKEKIGIELPKLPWYKWLVKPKFFMVIIIFMCTRIVQYFPQTYIPVYLTQTLEMDKGSIAKGPLVLFVASILTTLVVKRFNKAIGMNMTYFIGLVITWISLIWLWVKTQAGDQKGNFEWQRDSIYGATFLLGVGSATMVVIAFSMISTLVGKYSGSSAFVYGWMIFADRLSNGVIVKIVQSFQPEKVDSNLGLYIRNALVITPLAASLLGLLIVAIIVVKEWYAEKQKEAAPAATHEFIVNETRGKEYILSAEAREFLSPVMKEEEKPAVIQFFF